MSVCVSVCVCVHTCMHMLLNCDVHARAHAHVACMYHRYMNIPTGVRLLWIVEAAVHT